MELLGEGEHDPGVAVAAVAPDLVQVRFLGLLGEHRLAAAERLCDRVFRERDLAPVGAPQGEYREQLLWRAVPRMQRLPDAPRLAVERDREGRWLRRIPPRRRARSRPAPPGRRALPIDPAA